MKIFKKITVVVVSIFVLWVVSHFFAIGMSKNGVVVDSLTKKPLAGISVIRVTNSYTSNLEGSYQSEPMRIDTAVTDSNGRFSFSSFIKLKWWFKKADQLYINASHASDDHLSILNHSYFIDAYSSGFILPTGSTPSKRFNKYLEVSLAPIVSILGECGGDGECIQKNENYARICLSATDPKNVCGGFSVKGTMIFKNDKPFGDNLVNDFSECNNKTDDSSGAVCFYWKKNGTVINEPICDSLTHESSRNLCYYFVAISSPAKPICDKITKKPFPDEAVSYASDGVSNYKDLCIKERARMYN